jgi:hypothetical protein
MAILEILQYPDPRSDAAPNASKKSTMRRAS